jgi:hypothetical protein
MCGNNPSPVTDPTGLDMNLCDDWWCWMPVSLSRPGIDSRRAEQKSSKIVDQVRPLLESATYKQSPVLKSIASRGHFHKHFRLLRLLQKLHGFHISYPYSCFVFDE